MLLKNAGSKEKMIYLYLNTILNSEALKEHITQYYRTKHFKLDIVKYLLRGSADLC